MIELKNIPEEDKSIEVDKYKMVVDSAYAFERTLTTDEQKKAFTTFAQAVCDLIILERDIITGRIKSITHD